ncbi:MAG: energy transducer TonB [Planctomycetota bacterium]
MNRLIPYFTLSAIGHALIFIVFIFTPGGRQCYQDSTVAFLIKADLLTHDVTESKRIDPAIDFVSTPLQIETPPEISFVTLTDWKSTKSTEDYENHSVIDYSTEAKPIIEGSNKLPPYPKLACQLGQEGLVILMVEIDEKGMALDVKIVQSSGYKLLDESALKTVKKWAFIPATKNGKPILSRIEIPIRFKLT